MIWTEEYSVGVPHLDTQHQTLFLAINRIRDILDDHDKARDQRITSEALFFLEQHALRHFADEEAYMRSISDANYPLHKQQHDAILVVLAESKAKIADSGYAVPVIRKFLGTMLSWLVYHTLEVDRLIGKSSATTVLYDDVAIALEKTITQVLSDMLGITPVLIDSSFCGDFYGNELFCMVECSQNTGRQLHILFAVDQQVIQYAVSKMLGVVVEQTDELVTSALEELCTVLGLHFIKNCQSKASYQIEKSCLLLDQELPPVVSEDQLLCSLLFNDPYGSLLIRAWES